MPYFVVLIVVVFLASCVGYTLGNLLPANFLPYGLDSVFVGSMIGLFFGVTTYFWYANRESESPSDQWEDDDSQ